MTLTTRKSQPKVVKAALAALNDPAHAENPLRETVQELCDFITNMTRRLDKVSAIADQYQLQAKLANDQLEEASRTDLLTGLTSRREMHLRLEQEYSRVQRTARPCALLMIDLDHFRQVNEQHGDLIGDQVLARIAILLRATVRNIDVCSRWGGEEFFILLPETDQKSAVRIAERLRQTIADEPFMSGTGAPFHVTISIGGVMGAPRQSVSEGIQLVNAMLNKAKANGRNRLEFA